MSVPHYDICPCCNFDFRGDDIYDYFMLKYTNDNGYKYPTTPEKIRENAKHYPGQFEPLPPNLDTMTQNELDAWNTARAYGWTFENPKCFRNEIGIEVQGVYDGILYYQCPKCEFKWKRFSWTPDEYVMVLLEPIS